MKWIIITIVSLAVCAGADVLVRVDVEDIDGFEQLRAGQNIRAYWYNGSAYFQTDMPEFVDYKGYSYNEIAVADADLVFVIIPDITGYEPPAYLQSGTAGDDLTYYIIEREIAKQIPPAFANGILTPLDDKKTGSSGYNAPLNDTDKAAAVAMVDGSLAMDSVTHLAGYHSRYIGYPDNVTACDWIANQLDAFPGTSIELDYFTTYSSAGDVTIPNVLCTIEGLKYPDEYVIFGAHLDSIDPECYYDPNTPAPGADDNATGVGAVIEAARILSRFPFERSIIFAGWNAEEVGLIGSRHYAENASDNDMNIYCYLNVDCLGYEVDEVDDCFIIRGGSDTELFTVLEQNVEEFTELEYYTSYSYYSDYVSFWDEGYDAVGLAEGYLDYNPYINTSLDTLDLLNPWFYEQNIRAAVATVYDYAGIDSSPRIWVRRPGPNGDRAGTKYEIGWFDVDVNDAGKDATISLYYDTDSDGTGGTLIVSGIEQDEDDNTGDYEWNVSGVPDGKYYIYAIIDDTVNPPFTNVSEGTLTVQHTAPKIIAYPNPLRISPNSSTVTLTEVTAGDKICIYNISGQKILEEYANGINWDWSVSGDIASGVYIYQVHSTLTGDTIIGKVAVIK